MDHHFYQKALEQKEYTIQLRRDIHQHPEIQHQETRTAELVKNEMEAWGIEVKDHVATTGVLGFLKGGKPGPTVMIRADMDALTMQEMNDVPYASCSPGKMHACGHDGHVAMLLTAARLLSEVKDSLPGNILFLFQPAEEGGYGALRMQKAGALEWHRPDYCLGLHIWNEMPIGTMVIHGGPLMAGTQKFEVHVIGKGGHGAVPHQAIDPLLTAAQITVNLQSIVSRNISPLDSAVISVCMLQAGTASNVIPQSARLEGTMRAFTPQMFEHLIKRFKSVVQNTAAAMECDVEIILEDPISSTTNDDEIAELTKQAVRQAIPETRIDEKHQTMGSEDMSIWLDEVPGCFFFLGSANPAKGLSAPHHHPRFDFDEDVLPMGAAALASAAVHILQAKA